MGSVADPSIGIPVERAAAGAEEHRGRRAAVVVEAAERSHVAKREGFGAIFGRVVDAKERAACWNLPMNRLEHAARWRLADAHHIAVPCREACSCMGASCGHAFLSTCAVRTSTGEDVTAPLDGADLCSQRENPVDVAPPQNGEGRFSVQLGLRVDQP